jgi:hypothetical protein
MTSYSSRYGTPKQCRRKATHGDYCWQHAKSAAKETTEPSGKLYLINTRDDDLLAGPATDPHVLLSVAEEEIRTGTSPDDLLIVQAIYAIEASPAVFKLTEAR